MRLQKMNPYFVSLLLLLSVNILSSQSYSQEKIIDFDELKKIGSPPEFPGGIDELNNFFGATIDYPINEVINPNQGKVIAEFIIDKNGWVSAPTVIFGASSDFDREALRVLIMMPRWKPGELNGERVNVKFAQIINFRMHFSPMENETCERKPPRFSKEDKNALQKYIDENLIYDKNLLGDKNEIYIYIEFVVNKKGKVEAVDFMTRSRVSTLNKLAYRLVKNMPIWEEPGKLDGVPVQVRYVLPIIFKKDNL